MVPIVFDAIEPLIAFRLRDHHTVSKGRAGSICPGEFT